MSTRPVEDIKRDSDRLRGTLADGLGDATSGALADDDTVLIKFHGCYQQDDRDLRKTGKKYIMMIRTRSPGGIATAAQYLVFDQLATKYGNNTLRITTRRASPARPARPAATCTARNGGGPASSPEAWRSSCASRRAT